MANPNAPYGFVVYKDNATIAPTLERFPLDTGQTIAAGDVLMRNASTGKLTIYTVGSNYPTYVAQAAGNDLGDNTVLVQPLTYDTIFRAQSVQSTVLDQTYIGKVYEISGTTGAMGVNTSGTTYPVFRVIDFLPSTTVGAYAELLGIFIRNNYEAAGGFSQA